MSGGTTIRDAERIERIERALRRDRLDALVCTLPSNVLLLSGYWPVVGTSVAVATREGAIELVVPEDELDLAAPAWAEVRETFAPGTLEALPSLTDVLAGPLARVLRRLVGGGGRVGYERGPMLEPSSYAGTNRYASALPALVQAVCPAAELVDADDLLRDLRAVLTSRELARLRLACRVAGEAFRTGAASIVPGAPEREVAAAFRAPLEAYADREGDALVRAGGFTWCMSGPDAALAFRTCARTRNRRIRFGDLVMVHCNSYVDGLWTDITRTYHPGGVEDGVRELFDAVLAARRAVSARPSGTQPDTASASEPSITTRGRGSIRRRTMSWNPAWYSTWSPRSISTDGAACVNAIWWRSPPRVSSS